MSFACIASGEEVVLVVVRRMARDVQSWPPAAAAHRRTRPPLSARARARARRGRGRGEKRALRGGRVVGECGEDEVGLVCGATVGEYDGSTLLLEEHVERQIEPVAEHQADLELLQTKRDVRLALDLVRVELVRVEAHLCVHEALGVFYFCCCC